MLVLGLNASPRNQGNTAWIVSTILAGAKARGVETQYFNLGDLDIKPCRGCWACHNGDQGCVIKDGMGKLNEAIDRSEVVVLGSPIYMMQMSAQAKVFNDRLFAKFSPRYSPYFQEESASEKKLALTFNQGNPDASLFQSYIDYTKKMFELFEFEVVEVPVVTGMRNGPAKDREDLRAAMLAIGARLVSAKSKDE